MCDHPGSAEGSLAPYTTIESGFMTSRDSNAFLLYSSSETSNVFLLYLALQSGFVQVKQFVSQWGSQITFWSSVQKWTLCVSQQLAGFTDHMISERRWSLTSVRDMSQGQDKSEPYAYLSREASVLAGVHWSNRGGGDAWPPFETSVKVETKVNLMRI